MAAGDAGGCSLNTAGLRGLVLPSMSDLVTIEKMAFLGPGCVGSETFDTVRWEERFRSAALAGGYRVEMITRTVARSRLCGGPFAGDKHVRIALVERFGRKETRGLNVHTQAALAVAVVAESHIYGFAGS